MFPHLVPYQGSKRRLAPRILDLLGGRRFARLIEPFAGSAAVTLAAAQRDVAAQFVLGETLVPLAGLWRRCIDDPVRLAADYEALWTGQHGDPRGHYLRVRDQFNADPDPVALLYLLARCVKNAPRFAADGRFNQAADHRRRGRRPQTVAAAATAISALLTGRCEVIAEDFATTCALANANDLVYLDPPWVGTSVGKDKRYHRGLSRDRLVDTLRDLLARDVAFVLSYDGRTGQRRYDQPLPTELGLLHLEIDAGRSSQETLAGRSAHTFESLYVSPGLADTARQMMASMQGVSVAHVVGANPITPGRLGGTEAEGAAKLSSS